MATRTRTRNSGGLNSWLLEGVLLVLVGAVIYGAYMLGEVSCQLEHIESRLAALQSNDNVTVTVRPVKKTAKKIKSKVQCLRSKKRSSSIIPGRSKKDLGYVIHKQFR